MDRADEIITLLEKKRNELERNEKASEHYWNGDDWGSISGYKDARNWVMRSLAEYLMELLDE